MVSSSAELLAAIAACVGGETIKCGPATYSGVGTIDGKVFTTPITITRTGVGGAIFTNFNMTDCGGFNFVGLQMYVDAETYGAFRCERCSRITFSGCEIHGDPASFDDPALHFNGMNFVQCANCTVTSCHIHHLSEGIQHSKSTGFLFHKNHVHHMAYDAVEGSEVANATYSNNYLHDFHPNPGDHPDAFQMWTDNVGRSTNITYSQNVIMRGAGLAMQGVFCDDLNQQGYRDFVIDDNFLAGAGLNGICPSGSPAAPMTGVVITNNELWSLDDTDGGRSWIRVKDTVGTVVRNNKAREYILTENNPGLANSGNTINALTSDGGATELAAWLVTHPEMAWILTV